MAKRLNNHVMLALCSLLRVRGSTFFVQYIGSDIITIYLQFILEIILPGNGYYD